MYRLVVTPLFVFSALIHTSAVDALNVVLAGGTGKIGQMVASKLSPEHKVTMLTRNAYLAAAPNRVTETFGWVGESYLERHPHVSLRDWDGELYGPLLVSLIFACRLVTDTICSNQGGDLLDIVGKDWVGWQEDTLKGADVVVNLVGGYTEQREMATERIVRESFSVNTKALQISVAPSEEDIGLISPGAPTLKKKRLQKCEDMVKMNCKNQICLRMEAYKVDENVQTIVDSILTVA